MPWFPARFWVKNGAAKIEWRLIDDSVGFVEPSYDWTIENALRARHCPSTVTAIDGNFPNEIQPGSKPHDILFHLSRCGSSIVVKTLSTFTDSTVVSEPQVVSDVLRCDGISKNVKKEFLALVLEAFGSAVNPDKKFILKTISWHILFWRTFRDLCPESKLTVLVRSPLEVLVSALTSEPGWLRLAGNQEFRRIMLENGAPVPRHDKERYAAIVVGKLLEKAKELSMHGADLIDYADMPAVLWQELLFKRRPALSDQEMRTLRSMLLIDPKTGARFVDDSQSKSTRASSRLRFLNNEFCTPVYREVSRRLALGRPRPER